MVVLGNLALAFVLVSTSLLGAQAATKEPPKGYISCDNGQQCCWPETKFYNEKQLPVPSAGKCIASDGKCEQGFVTIGGSDCGEFRDTTPPQCGPAGCCISKARMNYNDKQEGELTPGIGYMCRKDDQTDCSSFTGFGGWQQFSTQDCAKHFPNMQYLDKQPVCKNNEYCCRQYASYTKNGNIQPGFETKCQAAGTGCEEGFWGSNDRDCNINYPTSILPPLPELPKDCTDNKYACVEYAGHTKNGKVLFGLGTTCQNPWEGCPAHYQGHGTSSFLNIWPNKNFEESASNCADNEYCCMEKYHPSQTRPGAPWIGGTKATCRPKSDSVCSDNDNYGPFFTNLCSRQVPNFLNFTMPHTN